MGRYEKNIISQRDGTVDGSTCFRLFLIARDCYCLFQVIPGCSGSFQLVLAGSMLIWTVASFTNDNNRRQKGNNKHLTFGANCLFLAESRFLVFVSIQNITVAWFVVLVVFLCRDGRLQPSILSGFITIPESEKIPIFVLWRSWAEILFEVLDMYLLFQCCSVVYHSLNWPFSFVRLYWHFW